jgi:hypothetical protein
LLVSTEHTLELPSFGKLSKGTYKIPFTITVPAGLPSTMSIFDYECRHASIAYWIKARLFREHHRPARAGTLVMVRAAPQPPLPRPSPPGVFLMPRKQDVKLCCWSLGSVVLGASVEDVVIGRGEPFSIRLVCKNESTATIRGITCKVTETVRWHANIHGEERRRVVASVDIPPPSGTAKLSKAEMKAVLEDAQQGDGTSAVSYQEIFNQLADAEPFHLVVTRSRDTYYGNNIQVSHELSIVLHTGCCITNPKITLPVRVGPAPHGKMYIPPELHPTKPGPPMTRFDRGMGPAECTKCDGGTLLTAPTDAWEASPTPDGLKQMLFDAEASPYLKGEKMSSQVCLDCKNDDNFDIECPMVIPDPDDGVARVRVDSLRARHALDSDLTMLVARAQNPRWATLFKILSPTEYATIISLVKLPCDAPAVAVFLASKIGSRFTCAHLAAAIENRNKPPPEELRDFMKEFGGLMALSTALSDEKNSVGSWRGKDLSSMAEISLIVELVAPLCVDIAQNAHLFIDELSTWQQVATRAALEAADALPTRSYTRSRGISAAVIPPELQTATDHATDEPAQVVVAQAIPIDPATFFDVPVQVIADVMSESTETQAAGT